MTAADMTWIGSTLIANQHCNPMRLRSGPESASWLPSTALVSAHHLILCMPTKPKIAPQNEFLVLFHAASRSRGWTPKICGLRSKTVSSTDYEATGNEVLAYVADVLTIGEFVGLGREVVRDFAVYEASTQPQEIAEPEPDGLETLNYAKIAGYLPMPSRLDRLIR